MTIPKLSLMRMMQTIEAHPLSIDQTQEDQKFIQEDQKVISVIRAWIEQNPNAPTLKSGQIVAAYKEKYTGYAESLLRGRIDAIMARWKQAFAKIESKDNPSHQKPRTKADPLKRAAMGLVNLHKVGNRERNAAVRTLKIFRDKTKRVIVTNQFRKEMDEE